MGALNSGFTSTVNYGTVANYFPNTGVTLVDLSLSSNGSYLVAVFNSAAGSNAVTVVQNPAPRTTFTGYGCTGGFTGFTGVAYSPAADVFVVSTTTPGGFLVSGRASTTQVGNSNTWVTVSVPSMIGVPRCITYMGWTNQSVAAGDAGDLQTAVVYSSNGTTWYPSYTYSPDTRIPSAITYDAANELWLIGAYVTGTPAMVFSSTPYLSSYTHRKLASTNASLKTLTSNCNSTTASTNTQVSTLQTNYNATVAQLASGFCSTLKDGIYSAMNGLGPSATQVNIEYHWTRVMDTVNLTGRIIIPGPVETTAGVSTGNMLKFVLPVPITGTFSSPGTVAYTYSTGPATVRKYNPRLLGHVFMDNKALVDSWEVYGEPGTNNVATILLNDNNSFSSSCIWFQIAYKLSAISYATTITNQLTNTYPAMI